MEVRRADPDAGDGEFGAVGAITTACRKAVGVERGGVGDVAGHNVSVLGAGGGLIGETVSYPQWQLPSKLLAPVDDITTHLKGSMGYMWKCVMVS